MTDDEVKEAADKINGPIQQLCNTVECYADYMNKRALEMMAKPGSDMTILQDYNIAASTMRELCKVTRHLSDLPTVLAAAERLQ